MLSAAVGPRAQPLLLHCLPGAHFWSPLGAGPAADAPACEFLVRTASPLPPRGPVSASLEQGPGTLALASAVVAVPEGPHAGRPVVQGVRAHSLLPGYAGRCPQTKQAC